MNFLTKVFKIICIVQFEFVQIAGSFALAKFLATDEATIAGWFLVNLIAVHIIGFILFSNWLAKLSSNLKE
jgi:heme/copper-type cytochrome/quinol oxidase subunit 4